jgi:hypothetical protein
MGCDIHLYCEVKIEGQWHLYSHPYVERNYDLFAKMANVRNDLGFERPISRPKGLPDDLSIIPKLEYKRDNYHSASWLNVEEIRQLEEWVVSALGYSHWERDGYWDYLCGNSWGGFTPGNSRSYCPEFEDVRFVFWFDN